MQARHCRQIRAGEMVGDYRRARRNGRTVADAIGERKKDQVTNPTLIVQPVGALATLGILIFIRETRHAHREPFDVQSYRTTCIEQNGNVGCMMVEQI